MGETCIDDNSDSDHRSDELLASLQHSDPNERERAALLLARPGNEQAVIPLIDALHDSVVTVRSRAAQSLGTIGDVHAVQPLISCLGDSDLYVRIEAAIALGRIDGDTAADAIVPLIKNRQENSELRAAAVTALGLSAGQAERYLDVLLEAAEDESEDVQEAALEALNHVNSVRTTDALIKLLQNRFNVSNNNMMDVISKLGEKMDPRAVEPLMRVLLVDHMVYRELAAEALGKIGDPRALRALERVLQDTHPEDDPAFYPQLVKTTRQAIEAIKAGRDQG